MSWVTTLAERCWDPVKAEKVLGDLERFTPETRAVCEAQNDEGVGLVNFLSLSPVSLEKLRQRPELLSWVVERGATAGVPSFQRQKEPDSNFTELREWKSQSMLRIAYREVLGLAGFVETCRDITEVAEVCVREVYVATMARSIQRWGEPDTSLAVLAMGKFGGRELNYSSDIDLIFFFGDDGFINPRFSYQHFFNRVAEQIIEAFSAKGRQLFRIDLRLRPEGAAGPLTRSLGGMENYYAGYGETWERMALIKARGIAGDPELLYEFEHRLQPFIYPRSVSSDQVEEVAEIKQRIERDLLSPEELHRNVKLGYGGIREVEFTVQALQLLHGARNPFLQERNTLETLTALVELGILPRDDSSALSAAYVFLRAVEHRLQIANEQQTHTLPVQAEQRFLTACSLGFDSVPAFDASLADQTRTVRSIFDRLLQTDRTKSVRQLDLSAFSDPDQARKTLNRLREGPPNVHVAPRTRRLYAKLEPVLLAQLQTAAESDHVLGRFVRFVDNYGIRGLLFETLLANPRLLLLLVKLFDASEVFSEIVLQRPELIEELARGRLLGKQETFADFMQRLDQEQPDLTPVERLRRFRRAEGVRILLRDALGFAELEQLQAEMTDLAEACLRYCCRFVPGAEELTLLAQGKFGGRELLYGADLDLVFIGRDKVAGGSLIQAMGAKTEAGRVFPIDARLRPEGENGPLVVSLETYRNYFQDRAQSWERQALTKARVVGGPVADDLAVVVDEVWNRFRAYPGAFGHIAHMYRRVVRERGSENEFLQFKTGRGGIMAIEFLIQAVGLRAGLREPNTSRAIERLAGSFEGSEADSLRASYLYLRRVESVLRRVSNSSISQLPSVELDQLRLAKRLGNQSREAFAEEYWDHRMRAEGIVSKYLG